MKQQIKERIERIKQGLVPSGYKQTPVGVCPNDWKFDTLGNLGEFSKGSGIPGYTLVESGIPCVGYGDLYTKYSIKFEKAKCFTDIETAKQSKEIVKGTLLFTGSGETAEEIGKCVCYNGDENICAGGDIVLFNTKKVNPLYISYQQNLDRFIKEKSKLGQGHSVVHIYANDLSTLSCLYPSEDKEQTKIANVLTTWDNAVELQEKKIEKLQEKKKALMQKLLTPKPDWKKDFLKNLTSLLSSGGTPSTKNSNYYNGKIVWASIDDLTLSGKYLTDSKRKLTKSGIENSSAKLFPKNTILYAMYASIGKCVIADIECSSSQAILGIIPSEKIDYEFLYYHLCNIREKMILQGQKGTQSNLNKDMVSNFEIDYPVEIEKQRNIANGLSFIDNNIAVETELLEKYKEQRKALMQLLLTGIVRV